MIKFIHLYETSPFKQTAKLKGGRAVLPHCLALVAYALYVFVDISARRWNAVIDAPKTREKQRGKKKRG